MVITSISFVVFVACVRGGVIYQYKLAFIALSPFKSSFLQICWDMCEDANGSYFIGNKISKHKRGLE